MDRLNSAQRTIITKRPIYRRSTPEQLRERARMRNRQRQQRWNMGWKRRAWSDRQVAAILEQIGTVPLDQLLERHKRTRNSIDNVLQRTRSRKWLRDLAKKGRYGVDATAELLGVDASTVRVWADRGWLPVEYIYLTRRERVFTRAAIRQFLFSAPGALLPAIRPSKDAWWVVAAYHEARQQLLSVYVSRATLAEVFCVKPQHVGHRAKKCWSDFPEPALAMGSANGGHWFRKSEVWAWVQRHPERQSDRVSALFAAEAAMENAA